MMGAGAVQRATAQLNSPSEGDASGGESGGTGWEGAAFPAAGKSFGWQ